MGSEMYSGWRFSSSTWMAFKSVLSHSYILMSILLFSTIAQSSSQSINSAPNEQDLLKRCPPNLIKSYLRAAPWGTCYEFHTDERTWSNANSVCQRNGGNLVTIKEERIQNFVYRALIEYRWPKNGLWIGATDSHREMDWKWVTGERVRDGYSKWARGQPSCGLICLEDCAIMRWKEAGKWHDYHCNMFEDYSYICEYKMLPEPSTTTQSTTAESTTTESTTTDSTTTESTTIESTTTESTTTESTTVESTTTAEPNTTISTSTESTTLEVEEEPQDNNTKPEMPAPLHAVPPFYSQISAHQGELSREASSSSSSLGQGSLSVLIIGVITLLSILILLLILFRRRRRSQEKEDEPGVSYANPFYGEAKQPLTAESPSRRFEGGDDGDDDANLKSKCAEMNFAHEGTLTFNLQPPVRTRHVMNHYDKPPTRYHTMKFESTPEKKLDPVNYYDGVNGRLQDGAYDSPRSFDAEKNLPDIPYCDSGCISEDLDFYVNEENIYESVENLQQRLINPPEGSEARLEDLDDTRYVPFALDGERDVA